MPLEMIDKQLAKVICFTIRSLGIKCFPVNMKNIDNSTGELPSIPIEIWGPGGGEKGEGDFPVAKFGVAISIPIKKFNRVNRP